MENCLFSKRNEAIDMLRGLTMLLMVFVNDLWSVGGVPHSLEHFEAFEDGMGLADFVFPMFLFAMGLSVPYALERRYAKGYSTDSTIKHILSRTVALLLMGVFIVNTEGGFASTLGYDRDFYIVLMVTAFFLIWNAYPSGMKMKKWLQLWVLRYWPSLH
jgi:predicted acyltransferase